MRRRYLWLLLPAAALGGVFTSYYLKQSSMEGAYTQALAEARRAFTPSEMIGQKQPAFVLKNLAGEPTSSERWAGKVLLINFWASWCPPCRREIPAFAEVRDFYHPSGFEVIGVAVDEQEAVEEFLQAMPQVRYPQLIGDADAVAFGRALGNQTGSLPYSVLVDARGVIRFVKYGELDKTTLIEKLEPLLSEKPL